MVASRFNGWVIDDGGKKRAFRYATLARRCRVPKGTSIADNRSNQPFLRPFGSKRQSRAETAGYLCQAPPGQGCASICRDVYKE